MGLSSPSTNLGLSVTAAVRPPELDRGGRDQVNLMVLDRASGERRHRPFRDIAQHFRPGDVLVVNNSATIPAAIPAVIAGHPGTVHLAARLSAEEAIIELRTRDGEPDWQVLNPGTVITLADQGNTAVSTGTVTRRFHSHSGLWVVQTRDDWYAWAPALGRPIRYHYVDRDYPMSCYSTIFGTVPGSSEMPSASRPFTTEILQLLADQGVKVAELTLHTTVSSHEIDDSTQDFPIVPEWFRIPDETQTVVQQARQRGNTVVALGTTVVRALETWAYSGNTEGWTTHLVTPKAPPIVVSGLVTGMHDSYTSHLWLLYAFVEADHLKSAYREAQELGYRWHEFGDLTLIR